jgi:acetoin:2,6-dichlorophenolindophenol oxidoreductase subunit alpha
LPEKSPVVKNIPDSTLRRIYLTMVRIRRLEERIADLVSGGDIACPCHLYIGQEAVAAGVGAALKKEDWVLSTHRSHGHYLAKGGDMKTLMAELYGKSSGCSHGRGGSMHLASPDNGLPGSSAIVAGTIPLAVGAALAFVIRKQNNVSVAFFGDGAFGEGVLYESLNFAALKKLPVVFVCENNFYSTHMPIAASLAETSIYKKAAMFAMPGVKVNGNDAAAVFTAASEAVTRARRGLGPTLIECRTYRWRGHVGPNYDIDKGLRSKEELERWMRRCPIKLLEKRLLSRGVITAAGKKRLDEAAGREVEEALSYARRCPYPAPEEITSHVFKD